MSTAKEAVAQAKYDTLVFLGKASMTIQGAIGLTPYGGKTSDKLPFTRVLDRAPQSLRREGLIRFDGGWVLGKAKGA